MNKRKQKSKIVSNPGNDRLMAGLFGGRNSKGLPRMYASGTTKGYSRSLYLPVLIPALLLIAYGLVVIWSASLSIDRASISRQAMGVALGLVFAAIAWRFDYRSLSNMTTVLLILDVVLMILPKIPGIGVFAMGINGWVRIPIIGLRFQPSEIAKLVTIFLMASLCAQYNGKIESFRDYVKLCAILCIPFFAILIQPDLGTGLIVLVAGAAIIICAGAKKTWVWGTIGLIVLASAFVIITSMMPGVPHILKEYQLNRLLVFVDPNIDPTGSGYNLQQAQIAVGSGGIFGKGIGNASQAGGGFLPEAHTDFVFSLLSEEFGFFGAIVLLLLFLWLMLATVSLAIKTQSMFAKLILVGIVAMWGFQVLENVGMNIGIMPITGIPLPFISYGSSSMVAQITSVGIVQSIWYHRTKSA